MNNKANVWVVAGVVIALILGLWGVLKTPSQNVVREIVREVGAMPGNSLEGPDFCVNGVCTYSINMNLSQATNTPISIKNPFQATSTIEWASLRIYTGTTTVATEFFEIATSSVSGATSTNAALIRGQIPTRAGGVWAWSPAHSTTTFNVVASYLDSQVNANQIKASEWIVMRIASTAPYTYGGVFQMVLRKN